jgi:hypothetical protein
VTAPADGRFTERCAGEEVVGKIGAAGIFRFIRGSLEGAGVSSSWSWIRSERFSVARVSGDRERCALSLSV